LQSQEEKQVNRQEKRSLADLRHRDRNKRIQKLLASKNKVNQLNVDADFATVIGVARGHATVFDSSGERLVRCDLQVAPGDEVSVRHEKVAGIGTRRTVLSRTDPGNPHRRLVIAANIELLVIVATLVEPAFRPGLVDRYLIAAGREGIRPLLCLNKSDLGGDYAAADVFAIPKLRCSAATGEGLADLRELIGGNTAVLVGHSGVGKSSLLNALMGVVHAATGEVAAATGKGRHTTTGSRVYVLPNGGRIIDTPGIREFGLGDIDVQELAAAFPEFDASRCRFSDCLHGGEPGCAVMGAAGARYEAWLRMRRRSGGSSLKQ
jgi:ribosome biogenesis GTPase / thiamine phosphate phosphatase